MRPYRLTRPPRPLRRRDVHLDNLALIPASLLPFKDHWQAVANDLPAGSVLIFLPNQEKQRRIACCVVSRLREQGRTVAVLNQEARQNAV